MNKYIATLVMLCLTGTGGSSLADSRYSDEMYGANYSGGYEKSLAEKRSWQASGWALQAKRYFEEKDYKNAEQLYRKAAELGDELAQNNLGVMYIDGEGVPQDIELGKAWLRKAAAQGSETARKNLAFIEQRQMEQRQQQSSGGRVKQDNTKWFGLAAFAGGMLMLFDHMDKNKARREAYKAEQAAAYARNPSCHERCKADYYTCVSRCGSGYNSCSSDCGLANYHCKNSCN